MNNNAIGVMSEHTGRSRRRLTFSSQSVSQPQSCALCHQLHTRLSSPQCWKNECCQKLALDLHLQPQSAVCHACRNELSRRTKDPNHKPRWEKDKQVKCAILNCEKQLFSHCGIPLDDIVGCLTKNGESIPTNLKNPVPFCNHHYHLVYNAYRPVQSHCPTCGSALKRGNARPCPNPHNIERYLSETTGFEGRITEGDMVCFVCYKSHLQILKEAKCLSTDRELQDQIKLTKSNVLQVHEVKNIENAISRAMSLTTIEVGEALLNQEALLLPAVHESFVTKVSACVQEANLGHVSDLKETFSTRWVLSNLTSSLQHHLGYACKLKKCGTVLYRANGDILSALRNALYKLTKCCKHSTDHKQNQSESEPSCDQNSMQVALNEVNTNVLNEIYSFLRVDRVVPFSFEKLDISAFVSKINPALWKAICTITQSASEKCGQSKVTDPCTQQHHIKTVRRFFCLCVIVYCTDDRCYLPLHNLITDVVDGLGGSTLLIQIMNRLGMCSSADTLARSIQFRVAQREKMGPQTECLPTSFTIVSIDNIDFLHRYARIFCGNQTKSWHGTTVQVVQPKPLQLSTSLQCGAPLHPAQSTQLSGDMNEYALTEPDYSLKAAQTNVMRRRKREVGMPYASPNCKSPQPKVQRRARTAMETHATVVTDPQTTLDTSAQSVHTSYRHMSLAHFRLSSTEQHSLDKLRLELYTYLWLKHHSSLEASPDHTFADLQEFFVITKPREEEKSNIVYFDVLDAIADNKETILLVLHKLRKQFIEGQGKQWLVVAGDAKVYTVLKLIHKEYGEEFNWLIPYPGDWHTLANYQKALLKPYFDAGLKELAKTVGYPMAQIQACSQFKRTHLSV